MTREPTDAEVLWFVPWECYECGGQKYAEEQAREELDREASRQAALNTGDPQGSPPEVASPVDGGGRDEQ